MLKEPHQGLPSAAEFCDLVEHQSDGFLDAAVGILLEPVPGLHEADRRRNDQFAAPGLLVAGRQGTLTQQIELILIETALQSQQQPIIALPRRIDRFLVDEHGVDDTAHLDELLPVAAVTGKPRHLPRAATAPTLPRQTSATILSKPARATPPAAEQPRSSSIVSMRDQPSAVRRLLGRTAQGRVPCCASAWAWLVPPAAPLRGVAAQRLVRFDARSCSKDRSCSGARSQPMLPTG